MYRNTRQGQAASGTGGMVCHFPSMGIYRVVVVVVGSPQVAVILAGCCLLGSWQLLGWMPYSGKMLLAQWTCTPCFSFFSAVALRL